MRSPFKALANAAEVHSPCGGRARGLQVRRRAHAGNCAWLTISLRMLLIPKCADVASPVRRACAAVRQACVLFILVAGKNRERLNRKGRSCAGSGGGHGHR